MPVRNVTLPVAGLTLMLAAGAAAAGTSVRTPQAHPAVPQLEPARSIMMPNPLVQARVQIRVQGELALMAIEEQLMAEFRTGTAARRLASRPYRTARRISSADGRPVHGTLEQAAAIFKTTKFEWPEFMPRGLR